MMTNVHSFALLQHSNIPFHHHTTSRTHVHTAIHSHL